MSEVVISVSPNVAAPKPKLTVEHEKLLRNAFRRPIEALWKPASDAANQLLREGYVVALIQMPLVGWNRDADGSSTVKSLKFVSGAWPVMTNCSRRLSRR